jgi:sarcosine oxidase
VIRQAYFEDPAYVPLLLRAYELWSELEDATRQTLVTITGGLMIGLPDSAIVQGSRLSAQMHGLAHELLDRDEICRRYPALVPLCGEVGLFEPNAGFIRPEKAVLAHLEMARRRGADLRFEQRVLGWEAKNGGVRVWTAEEDFWADRLVLSAGAWMSRLMGDLGGKLVPERQVLYWFEPIGGVEPFRVERFPIFIYESAPNEHVYGFPTQEGEEDSGPGGVKVAFYRQPDPCDPDQLSQEVNESEVARIRQSLTERLPSLSGPLLHSKACLYTMSPDQHFVVGLHPEHANVVVASPCSGHGFKFCSVMGEVLADLAVKGRTEHPIDLFSPQRLINAS